MKRFALLLLCVLGQGGFCWAQSSRPGMGAIPYAVGGSTGVTFRIWAPHASSVSVAGEFNGWDMNSRPLTAEPGNGLWSADVAEARAGHTYKYVINGSAWRRDPWARLHEAEGDRNSIVYQTNAFSWAGSSYALPALRDLVLYEMHVGTFNDTNRADSLPAGFLSITNRLPHLKQLGVNAIELMPVNDFSTARSWGYNLAYPYAIERTYGDPDSLKRLVQTCHSNQLGVMLDVVYNHFGDDDHADWSLWRFDGWSVGDYGGLFFFNQTNTCCSSWGPRPNYDLPEVRNYIIDNLAMWKSEYRIDGFRWDTPKHIIYTDWTLSIPITNGQTLIQEARARLNVHFPGTLNIAEDNKELSAFDGYWDTSFHDRLRTVMETGDDNARDMFTLMAAVSGTPRRIVFTESHDTAGDLNGGKRFPMYVPWSADNGYYSKKRSLLASVFAFTAPGTPMLLQGQEMMETNQFSDAIPIDWSLTNTYSGIVSFYRDLIRLRRNLDGVSRGLRETTLETLHLSQADKTVAYRRGYEARSPDDVFVIANLRNSALAGYQIPFPAAGRWYVYFNSDETRYSPDFGGVGPKEVVATGTPAFAQVDLGRYSALVLSRRPSLQLVATNFVIDDERYGNGNGAIDPGEGIQETITLLNPSATTASNIAVYLTTSSSLVRVTHPLAAYSNLSPDGAGVNLSPLRYRLSTNEPCADFIDFNLVCAYNDIVWTNDFRHQIGYVQSVSGQRAIIASNTNHVPILDRAVTSSTVFVDVPLTYLAEGISVTLRADHSYVGDVSLSLVHPDGTELVMCRGQGASGTNFGEGPFDMNSDTAFDDYGETHISEGTAPFILVYRPLDLFSNFTGKTITGAWKLRIEDSYAGNEGMLLGWRLKMYYHENEMACDLCDKNSAPIASNLALTVMSRTSSNVVFRGMDYDEEPLMYQMSAPAGHGSVSGVNTANWSVLYTPAHGFSGQDRFTYRADDGFSLSSAATVTVSVASMPDTDSDGLPDWWEQQYFGSITGAVATADNDQDGARNLAEYGADTHPQASNSCLRITSFMREPGREVILWPSVGGVQYRLEYADVMEPSRTGLAFTSLVRSVAAELDSRPQDAAGMNGFTNDFSLIPAPSNGAARVYRLQVVR